MNLVKKSFILLIVVAAICLCSCATQVKVVVDRPAELNMNGANSIAILPIQANEPEKTETINFLGFFTILRKSSTPSTREQLADYLTNSLTSKLLSTSYYTVVDSAMVEGALKAGNKPPVDVYLTGSINQFNTKVTSEVVENDDGTTTVYYKRTADVSVNYRIIDATTGAIVAMRKADYSRTSSSDTDEYKLPSAYDLLTGELDRLASKIMKEVQPYQETMYLSLLKDKTKDPDFAEADQYAKNGAIELSYEKFQAIYDKTGYYEAGYNAAILLQALGKLEDARDAMKALVAKTGDKKAISALAAINREIASAEKFKQQQADKAGKN